MGVRGRKSGEQLTVLPKQPLEAVERQRAPHDLTDEETEIWAAVINSQPADWFSPANIPLLSQYCRHVIQAKRIAELVEKATADPNLSIQDYDRLLKMAEPETRAIAALASRMRICQQALTNHRGHKKAQVARKLWEG